MYGPFCTFQDTISVSNFYPQQYLFVTNAGSNTLSFFVIDDNDPLHPKLVGNPAPTLGETPVSVAYSPKIKQACVTNAGSTAGITCYSVSSTTGLTAVGGLRFIPQTENSDPTTPPPGPLVLLGDVSFNPSETALFTSVRSNGAQPGLIYAYPVQNGTVGTKAVVSSLSTIPFAFDLNFLDNNDSHLMVMNPHFGSPGASFVTVHYPSLEITLDKDITVPGQLAVCWIVYAPQYDSVYLIDAGQPTITVVNPESGDVKGQYPYSTPSAGGEDSRIDRKWLYVLTDTQPAANSTTGPLEQNIKVFDINTGGVNPVQSFGVGKLQYQMGLAIYPSTYTVG